LAALEWRSLPPPGRRRRERERDRSSPAESARKAGGGSRAWSWTLNRNWPAGLRYVVAGLAQLGRLEEAEAALKELKLLNPNLAFVEGNLQRLFQDRAAVDHILDGLRKAGFE
jgi:hypothetical protein